MFLSALFLLYLLKTGPQAKHLSHFIKSPQIILSIYNAHNLYNLYMQ